MDAMNAMLTDMFGPFGPLMAVGALGLLLILLTLPILLKKQEDPLSKLKKNQDRAKSVAGRPRRSCAMKPRRTNWKNTPTSSNRRTRKSIPRSS